MLWEQNQEKWSAVCGGTETNRMKDRLVVLGCNSALDTVQTFMLVAFIAHMPMSVVMTMMTGFSGLTHNSCS